MIGIDLDFDPTSSRRESAAFDLAHVRNVVRVADFLTIWKTKQFDLMLSFIFCISFTLNIGNVTLVQG
jgi:hypothetical protein